MMYKTERIKCEYDIGYKAFCQIETANHLHAYVEARNKGNQELHHYTSLETINNILTNGKLRFSCVSRFNDEIDREQFLHKQYYYAMCFSVGENENLPLWYLYSGINGQGGRITFKRKYIDLLENTQLELCEYDYTRNKQIGVSKVLAAGDRTFIMGRVVYERTAKNGRFCDLKYSNLTNYNRFTLEEMNTYKKEHIGFVKKIVWAYEKEFRIVIKVNKDLIQEGKEYAIFANIDDNTKKKVKIRLAPECIDEAEVLSKYNGIKQFIINTSKLEKSEYVGQMKMGLCDKCKLKGK